MQGKLQVILDNLYAQKKVELMIVVLPNGRAIKNDRSVGNIYDNLKVAAFATFEKDLISDLIPYIEKSYPVLPIKNIAPSPDFSYFKKIVKDHFKGCT